MTKNDNDPLSGYRPDMDQHRNVNDEVDGEFRMIGNVIIVIMVLVGAGLCYGLYHLISLLFKALT